MPPEQGWPRGQRNALHNAAECCCDRIVGSEKLVLAIILRDSVDVNQGDPKGRTPLFLASLNGGSGAVRILLQHGASVAIAADGGVTPLHVCAQEGHLAIKDMLVKAGASVRATTPNGATPLDLAAGRGHSKMVASLIKDGADVNSRLHDTKATPLVKAAFCGHLEVVRELLRAKADPLLTQVDPSGGAWVPLDLAAQNGHTAVVRKMVQQLRIGGCGGASGGVNALHMAAGFGHVEIMAILTNAGVVDPGIALAIAAETSSEASVKFLLKQQDGKSSKARGKYVNNTCGAYGKTPLACCIDFAKGSSLRVVRRLIDAGADSTAAIPAKYKGLGGFGMTPLDRLSFLAREKKVGTGEDAKEEQLLGLEGLRRLLLRVDAIRAVSWLWPRDATTARVARASGSASGSKTTPAAKKAPLVLMLPALRRRNERRGVFLAALFRYSEKR